jgi:16S rRNA (cytosine1402-N4)-methyltransferase
MNGALQHRPVLCQEVLEALAIAPAGVYLDCTFGRGGHSAALLERLGADGRVLAIDKDAEAVAQARQRFAGERRLDIEQGSFARLGKWVDMRGWQGKVDGVLMDLGVSSPQLDDAARGFSFRRDGDLDMRMDRSTGPSAAEWLATVGEADLARVLKDYGEERYARRIARALIAARAQQPITRTRQLAEIIAAAQPAREPGKDPATRSFQAMRIFINRELDDLDAALPQALAALKPGGRLAVISFHSLEDRIVKRFMRSEARGGELPPGLPLTESQIARRLRLIGKERRPTAEEVNANPRARSAVLRVAEKLQ